MLVFVFPKRQISHLPIVVSMG